MSDGYELCGGCDELRADKRVMEATIAELRERHETFVRAAHEDIKRAFRLGEIHWQQADSESWSQNKKAGDTRAKFDELLAKYALCDAALTTEGQS